MAETVAPQPLSAPLLQPLHGIRHGFFGRKGGVSSGIYESLNMGRGSGDDPPSVAANRAAALACLGGARLFTPYQVHGTDVWSVDWQSDSEAPPRADVVVTRTPGIMIGIVTADCGPVLLADAHQGVIAACHAGWRGAMDGVIETAIGAMESLGARRRRIQAALGPMIAQKSYEVGAEVRAAFLAKHPDAGRFFAAGRQAGKYQFDLDGAILDRLAQAGIGACESLGRDSYAEADRFYSYRRTTHRGESDYGRQLSAILLMG